MRNRNIAKYLKPCVGGQTKEMKSHNDSELHRTTFHREVWGGGGRRREGGLKMKCPSPTG